MKNPSSRIDKSRTVQFTRQEPATYPATPKTLAPITHAAIASFEADGNVRKAIDDAALQSDPRHESSAILHVIEQIIDRTVRVD